MIPAIFQDFAESHHNNRQSWEDFQKKVLKKTWHINDVKGLSAIKYQVRGPNKPTTVNVILFEDVSRVFGKLKMPKSNHHLD